MKKTVYTIAGLVLLLSACALPWKKSVGNNVLTPSAQTTPGDTLRATPGATSEVKPEGAPEATPEVKPEATPETIKWYAIDEVLAHVAQAPKKVFIDVYTNWCGYCKLMDRTTFSDPKVAAYLNKHFYPVKLNAEQRLPITFGDRTFTYIDEYHANELAIALLQGKMSYPSVAYMNEQGQLLSVVPGYQQSDGMLAILVFFAEYYDAQLSWEEYLHTVWPVRQQEN